MNETASKIIDVLVDERQLWYVTIQLTKKCNFQCKYCYQTPEKKNVLEELNNEDWYRILDEIYDFGCRTVKFTGGEIFCYKDFAKVYKYAWNKGMIITLFTNGYLLTDELISLFQLMPPKKIRISIYGNNNERYLSFSKIKNGWSTVSKNIEKLVLHKIITEVSCVLNKDNVMYVDKIFNFAKSLGIKCSIFTVINAFEDGNAEPLNLQLPADVIKEKLTELGVWREYLSKVQARESIWREGYKKCNAGLTSCNIDNMGRVYLCEFEQTKKISLLDQSMSSVWKELLTERKERIEKIGKCSSCNKKNICGMCFPVYNYVYKNNSQIMQKVLLW